MKKTIFQFFIILVIALLFQAVYINLQFNVDDVRAANEDWEADMSQGEVVESDEIIDDETVKSLKCGQAINSEKNDA